MSDPARGPAHARHHRRTQDLSDLARSRTVPLLKVEGVPIPQQTAQERAWTNFYRCSTFLEIIFNRSLLASRDSLILQYFALEGKYLEYSLSLFCKAYQIGRLEKDSGIVSQGLNAIRH